MVEQPLEPVVENIKEHGNRKRILENEKYFFLRDLGVLDHWFQRLFYRLRPCRRPWLMTIFHVGSKV